MRHRRRPAGAQALIAVVAAGALGAVARYLAMRSRHWLLVVNVVGSFLLGLTSSPVVGAGFCGGLTTFSGFAVTASARDAVVHMAAVLAAGAAGLALG